MIKLDGGYGRFLFLGLSIIIDLAVLKLEEGAVRAMGTYLVCPLVVVLLLLLFW